MDWAFEWDPLGEGVLIEAYEPDLVAKYFVFTPEKNLYRNLPVLGPPYISPDGQKFAYFHTPGEDFYTPRNSKRWYKRQSFVGW